MLMKIIKILLLILLWMPLLGFSWKNQHSLRVLKPHALPHWEEMNHQASFKAFQKSCEQGFLAPPSGVFSYQIQKIKKLCQKATKMPEKEARNFFEKNFLAYQQNHHPQTLFTGYYAPTFQGSLVKTNVFQYPIYARPSNLIDLGAKHFGKIIHGKVLAFDERKDIAKGSIRQYAKVLAWVKKPMDALELEIQGTGAIQTPEKMVYLQYDSQNGRPYYPIGKFLIADGKISREHMSMLAIREYFDKHPKEVAYYFNQNPSYVFFKEIKRPTFLGYHHIPLSPHYSLAVDRKKLPMGLPIWIETALPNQKKISRLMVAQDVGGAIKGYHHFDIYFGRHIQSQEFARKMQSYGQYWVFLPA
jgi:membrane-bound lytic murein transglycosylase A